MLRKLVSSTLLTTSVVLALTSTSFSAIASDSTADEQEAPRNLIMVIGDGMGFPYLSAYRYFKDGRGMTEQADMEHTTFDRYLVGTASTYPGDDTLVTDSAASATALATGHKTYNGSIGLDPDGQPLKSMMEYANEQGMLTAGLSTVQVTHATPAAFFTKVENRSQQDDIADQFATQNENGNWKFDLLLGGGRDYFVREGDDEQSAVNHFEHFRKNGVAVVESMQALQSAQDLPLVGVLADRNMPYVIDDKPRLKEMAEQSLRLLESADRPFVIMIEASMIDWCGHGNDIGCAMDEMTELEQLLDYLIPYVEERGDTALVVTADHSTGGLTLGAEDHYEFRAAEVRRQGRSLRAMATDLQDMPWVDWEAYIETHLPYPLSTDQQEAIAAVAEHDGNNHRDAINAVLLDILNYHTRTGWTTGGHTGEDVPVIAAGPWAEHFRGTQDHTDIANQFIEWINR